LPVGLKQFASTHRGVASRFPSPITRCLARECAAALDTAAPASYCPVCLWAASAITRPEAALCPAQLRDGSTSGQKSKGSDEGQKSVCAVLHGTGTLCTAERGEQGQGESGGFRKKGGAWKEKQCYSDESTLGWVGRGARAGQGGQNPRPRAAWQALLLLANRVNIPTACAVAASATPRVRC